MSALHVREPEASELRACALAAVAEAGVVCLPASLVLAESGALDVGVGVAIAPFLAAFVGGTLLACRFRATANLAAAAGVLSILLGLALGRGAIGASGLAIIVVLLVELRVLTLALRDWRAPIDAEIGWGAAALGVEAVLAAAVVPEWRPLLAAFVPVFFAAALASRGTTVWTSGRAGDVDAGAQASWVRRSMLASGTLGLGMTLTVVLSIRGGLLDLLGRVIRPFAVVAMSVLVWLVAQAARPILWFIERMGIDPEAVREILDRLRASAANNARRARELPPPGTSGWGRFLGLIVLVAVGYALYRVVRRRAHPEPDVHHSEIRPGGVASDPLPLEPAPQPRSRFRRELPADAIRRSYAQVLIALHERRISKEPALTPGEFVLEVEAAFPESADDFRALTRAYEDVRYGGRRIGRADARTVEVSRRRLLALLQRGPRGRSS